MIEKQKIEIDVLVVAIAIQAFGIFCVCYTLAHLLGAWGCVALGALFVAGTFAIALVWELRREI
jgi:hypothetical protein